MKIQSKVPTCTGFIQSNGWSKPCGGAYSLLPVIVVKDGASTVVCEIVFCPKCRKFKRAENGRPIAVGPFVHKPDYKLFNIPRDWWQGDWPWRQKFAWELISLVGGEESFGSAISVRFEDIAARVGAEVKPNPAFEFDDRSVFDIGD